MPKKDQIHDDNQKKATRQEIYAQRREAKMKATKWNHLCVITFISYFKNLYFESQHIVSIHSMLNYLLVSAYHHFVFGYPAVGRKVLKHRHKELQTAIPVAQQQHHTNQIHYTHHSTSQVIGHVKNLGNRKNETDIVTQTEACCTGPI